ncbi:MAG: hypothetical protein HUU50_03085 [Candidatus Brocadiae bacterium]|nr:hypothetical protein [Candidatus Brocadiia bacterium]
MNQQQYILSVILIFLGGCLAVLNGWSFFREFVLKKRTSSPVPFLGGIFLFWGLWIMPKPEVSSWAWAGLFLDLGCLPYLMFGLSLLALEARRYSLKNCLLCLSYTTQEAKGSIHVYPKKECILKYALKNNMACGSLIMQVLRYEPEKVLEIKAEEKSLLLAMQEKDWVVLEESGWNSPKISFRNAQLSLDHH